MKLKHIYIFIAIFLGLQSCQESFLDVVPEDKITSATFWTNKNDAHMALMGVYNKLKDDFAYGYGGGMDACTPNAFQWAWWEGMHQQVGSGVIQASDTWAVVDKRWTGCYAGINRINYMLENIEKVELSAEDNTAMLGELYFLRGVFYSLLAQTYGGVPIVTKTLTSAEARNITRNTIGETWSHVHKDYDEAISRLKNDAPEMGRATLGAAYGMKMRAYLYTSEWDKVLENANKVIALSKYELFPSYYGLFQLANENNQEVIFDVQFIAGSDNQGSMFDRLFQPQNLANGIDGSNSVAPIQDLVDAYETIDGAAIDPMNPYANRDPRLDFTVLRPGASFQGQSYPDEIRNHNGAKVSFGIRKYTIETQTVKAWESPLNFIVLRYADVLLAKAEALIEGSSPNVAEAIGLINQIRTARDDVKISLIPTSLTVTEAQQKLRHERRIEFALEGVYWSDIKRWGIGPDIYPLEVRGRDGDLIHTKFPNNYDLSKDNLVPIPDSEIGLNAALKQNPGY